MSMTVAVTASSAQFTPRRNRNPRAKRHQRDARRRVDDVAEACRNGDTREPNGQRNQQCRDYMAKSGLKRRSRCLALRPAALARHQGDRHPVVWNEGVQDANGGNHADQQQSGTEIHGSSS